MIGHKGWLRHQRSVELETTVDREVVRRKEWSNARVESVIGRRDKDIRGQFGKTLFARSLHLQRTTEYTYLSATLRGHIGYR